MRERELVSFPHIPMEEKKPKGVKNLFPNHRQDCTECEVFTRV